MTEKAGGPSAARRSKVASNSSGRYPFLRESASGASPSANYFHDSSPQAFAGTRLKTVLYCLSVAHNLTVERVLWLPGYPGFGLFFLNHTVDTRILPSIYAAKAPDASWSSALPAVHALHTPSPYPVLMLKMFFLTRILPGCRSACVALGTFSGFVSILLASGLTGHHCDMPAFASFTTSRLICSGYINGIF